MIAQEACYLNKEIKRLQKYGIDLIVQPDGDKYNIRFKNSNEWLEPYCSPTEVLGIINSIENILEKVIKNEKIKNNNMESNNISIIDSKIKNA